MFLTDSEQWAEDHDEHVGYCRVHHQRVLGSCEECEDDEEHDCEWLSTCCGAGSHEHVDQFCGACNEAAEFECEECSTVKTVSYKGTVTFVSR
jgi:hypothetical protein